MHIQFILLSFYIVYHVYMYIIITKTVRDLNFHRKDDCAVNNVTQS